MPVMYVQLTEVSSALGGAIQTGDLSKWTAPTADTGTGPAQKSSAQKDPAKMESVN